ncbi:MAG: hypothetical protein ACRDHL_08570 [Candidatus Promineifilaceae bacterium]
MRKRMLLLFVLTAVLLIAVSVASAQGGPPGSGYWFGATHQNVGNANAAISIVAYDSASSATYTYNPPPLAPGASLNVGPDDIPSLPAGFVGSMVTSSDQPLVALVNVTNRLAGSFGTPNGKGAAIYSGVDGSRTSADLSFPLAKHNHFNKTTTFYLQNAGASATTISLVFSFGGIDYPHTTPSIDPGQMVAVDPGQAGVPAASVGAMTMSSAEPIAGAMLEHEHSAAVGTVLQGSGGFAPSELEQVVYCPTYKQDHFGRRSGLQVQNVHTVAQDVTVEFINATDTFVSTVQDLAPGASVTFINDPNIISGTLFAATVTGELGPVAGIVNESELPLVNPLQTSTTYNCQAAGLATGELSYPAYKELWFGRTAALQIQNVGGAAANVVLSFTDNNNSVHTTNPQSIQPGASSVFVCVSANAGLWSGAALSGNTLSGVTVTADQPIIAVANEASWADLSPCLPDNSPASFDKSTSNSFNG